MKVDEYPVAGKPWGTAKLWLIDEARHEYGRKDSMLELCDRHFYECRIFPAHLVHVAGLEEVHTDGNTLKDSWSLSSIKHFVDICEGNCTRLL